MPKINQEEYEILQFLNNTKDWIVRNPDGQLWAVEGGAPWKAPFYETWEENDGQDTTKVDVNSFLFQFIQWEDESPYNIQELIEEYLYDNQPKLFIDGQEQSFEFIEESEETEVKDLEWVKAKLKKDYADGKRVQSRIKDGEKIEGIDIKSYWRGSQTANYIARCYLEDLDEPEVLSQELPVIPKFVAEWIEEVKPDNSLRVAFEYIAQQKRDNHDDELAFWVEEGNSETFARAWLDGFTIANEDEELWKPIENYEGLYEVSNKGNVRSLDRDVQYKKTDFTMKIKGVDLKPNVLKKGYLQVGLSKNGKRKSMLVHRLVMNAFNPTTDENLQINHIDGNKENNEVSNLEWVTAIENTNHAYDTGLRDDTIGNNRKLTEDEVLEIIDLYETGNYTQKELGNKYNIGRNTVGEILLGKTWSWLTGITKEIEQEPRYYAKIKGHENIGSNDKYWNYNTDMEELSVGDSEVHPNVISEYMIKATKDEWANLGINDDNADFVKIEELEE